MDGIIETPPARAPPRAARVDRRQRERDIVERGQQHVAGAAPARREQAVVRARAAAHREHQALDPVAVDYIWQHFAESYINEEDLEISQQVGKLLKAAQHQPDDVESPGHQTFLERQLATIDQLENKHPFLALSAERQLFQSRKTVG